MQSRTAAYFKKLVNVSSDVHYLANIVEADKIRQTNLLNHKAELDRVYKLIEQSAKRGGIRVFIPHTDPLWNNDAVIYELRQQGFEVSQNSYTSQGAIEWWHVEKKKELA